MKKYNNSSQPVTKTDLENALKKYATKTDLKGLETRFETNLKGLEIRFDIKLDRLKEGIDDNARKYRDDVLTKLDGVIGELQTMREENTIGTYQTRELKERVNDHEKRITRLETP